MDTMTEILNTYEIDNNIDTGTEDSYEKNTRRAVRRKRNAAKALRKKKIAPLLYGRGHEYYSNLHQYSKNKIHCSCWMCAFNHPKSGWKSITHSDMKKIEKIKFDEKEYNADECG